MIKIQMVRIEQGEIISGIIDLITVGAKARSLIHIIFNEYGTLQRKCFINGCNKLIGEFLMSYQIFEILLIAILNCLSHLNL